MAETDYSADIVFDEDVIDRLAVWLREVGLRLLACALGYPSDSALDYELEPFSLPSSERTQTSEPHKKPECLPRLTNIIPDGNVFPAPRPLRPEPPMASAAFKTVVEGTIQNHALNALNWQRRIVYELMRRLDVDPLYRLPRGIWPLVEIRAWHDLGFQRDVARQITRNLYRRVLALPDFEPSFQLQPRTFWMLIEMGCSTIDGQQKAQRPFFARVIRRQRFTLGNDEQTIAHLQRLAEERGRSSGQWAKLWDQWVLLEARANWNIRSYSRALDHILLALPLQNTHDFANAVGGASSTDPSQLAHPDWHQGVPEWFKTWHQQ